MEPPRDNFFQLALKGERAIKSGALREGIGFLEKAIAVGSTEQRSLSAVYNQLGNAHCQLNDYGRSNMYFFYDLIITRILKDKDGEAKVCSNISNVFKLQRDYTKAADFAELHLKIGLELQNKYIQGMALQSLGSIYLAKGKDAGKNFKSAFSALNVSMGSQDGTICTMRQDVIKSFEYFSEKLKIAEEMNDRRAVGATYGWLGNCCYVLRDFDNAIKYHTQRLQVAREFGDKDTQRKAYINLGNTYVFQENIDKALECYRLALSLAMELDNEKMSSKAIRGQICFSLATASTLSGDYQQAADYHLKHLGIARDLKDTAGEARAHASLSTVFKLMGDFPKAAYFLARRRSIAKQLNDPIMSKSADLAFNDLLKEAGDSVVSDKELLLDSSADPQAESLPTLRLSLSLNSIHETFDLGLSRRDVYASDSELSARTSKMSNQQEEFFDMITRLQSKRMDEQRCDAPILNDISNRPPRQRDTAIPSPNASIISTESKKNHSLMNRFSKTLRGQKPLFTSTPLAKQFSTATLFSRGKRNKASCSNSIVSFDATEPIFRVPMPPKNDRRHSLCAPPVREGPDTLIDQLMQAQGRRMDEQRANLLPGLRGQEGILQRLQEGELEGSIVDEQFLDLVAKTQSQRINEQRSELGGRTKDKASTIPEDDLTELVTRMASTRIEEQRAHLPETKTESKA